MKAFKEKLLKKKKKEFKKDKSAKLHSFHYDENVH